MDSDPLARYHHLSVRETRRLLSQVVAAAVDDNLPTIITSRGKPVAAVMPLALLGILEPTKP